jgi:hypothetical protein
LNKTKKIKNTDLWDNFVEESFSVSLYIRIIVLVDGQGSTCVLHCRVKECQWCHYHQNTSNICALHGYQLIRMHIINKTTLLCFTCLISENLMFTFICLVLTVKFHSWFLAPVLAFSLVIMLQLLMVLLDWYWTSIWLLKVFFRWWLLIFFWDDGYQKVESSNLSNMQSLQDITCIILYILNQIKTRDLDPQNDRNTTEESE